MIAKRLAIQLFGHLRTFEHTFENFKKNVIEPNKEDGYEIDIFIHTWDQHDHNTVSYRQDGTSVPEKLTDIQIDRVKKAYNPKKISITSQQDRDELIIIEKLGKGKRSIKGCLNIAYTLFRGSELRQEYENETATKYDYVFITRPDILFLNPIKIDSILSLYDEFGFEKPENGLYYAYNPFRGKFGIEDPRIVAGSDLIYFAEPKNADKAVSLYKDFDNNIDVNNFYCFEVWQMQFWKKMGIEPLQMNYIFVRDWLVLYKEMVSNLAGYISNHTDKSSVRIASFLGLPIMKIKRYGNKTKYYLFGFIRILKIKER